MGHVSAVAVTVSNGHPNHSYWRGVDGIDKILEGPGEYELSGIYVRGIMTPRNESDGLDQRNTAYVVEMEGLSVCHLGDIKNSLTARQAEQLKPVDILFLPVGSGECTLELPQTIQLMHTLSPKLIFPMHYNLPGLQSELGDLEPFVKEMALQDIQAIPKMNVTASSLPAEPRVVILQAQGVQTESQ